MLLSSIFAILLAFSISVLNAQSPASADNNSSNNTSLQQQPMDKPGKASFINKTNLLY
jgi:hypothetical protein